MSRDKITGLLLVLVGVIVAIMVSQFSLGITAEYPGPKLFPLIAAIGMIVLGVGIFFEKKREEKEIIVSVEFFKRMACCFVLLILYLLGLKFVGYLISSPIFLYCVVTLFAKKDSQYTGKAWKRIVFSIVFCAVVYAFYVYLFGTKLPEGLLFS